jgi:hypothetical protein
MIYPKMMRSIYVWHKALASKAQINPPDINCASAKFTMRAMLTPVGFNEMLDFSQTIQV